MKVDNLYFYLKESGSVDKNRTFTNVVTGEKKTVKVLEGLNDKDRLNWYANSPKRKEAEPDTITEPDRKTPPLPDDPGDNPWRKPVHVPDPDIKPKGFSMKEDDEVDDDSFNYVSPEEIESVFTENLPEGELKDINIQEDEVMIDVDEIGFNSAPEKLHLDNGGCLVLMDKLDDPLFTLVYKYESPCR